MWAVRGEGGVSDYSEDGGRKGRSRRTSVEGGFASDSLDGGLGGCSRGRTECCSDYSAVAAKSARRGELVVLVVEFGWDRFSEG